MRLARLPLLLCAALAASALAAAPASAATSTQTTLGTVAATAGTPVKVTATISPTPSGGTVAFADGSKTVCATAAVSSGRASCTLTLLAGTHTIAAKYSGTSAYGASAATKQVVVAGPGSVIGGVGACTSTKGALVAVTFAHWNGPIVRGCDTTLTTGYDLLTTAGFTTTGTQHDGPAFLCRIGHHLFSNGTQYPTPTEDPCVRTPPSTAYWSFWRAAKGSNTWTYSTTGAFGDRPSAGMVEAWVYGGTNTSGTTGKPTFTPNQIRAGLPTGTAPAGVVQPHALRAALAPHAATADLSAGTGYLVTQLVNGHYYDPFNIGFADYGLTMDGALALAAAGDRDTALRGVVTFLNTRGKDASNRTVDDYTGIGTSFASAGAIAKEALVAEAAGYNPRSFGGHNLIATLDGLVCTATVTNVCAAPGNYRFASSTFSQTLGILAQLRAGDSAGAQRPIAYLESLQHSSGAFPSVLPGSDSDVDSTAMAAMALALVPTTKARTAVARALAWIAARQTGDGGFPGAAGDSTNSAALAIQALRLDARTYAGKINDARAFLAGLQNSDGGFCTAAGDPNGSDLRASTQAVGGVVGTPFGSVLDHLPAHLTVSNGANYLVGQLENGDHYATSFGGQSFPDQGLTADGVFALVAAGGHAATVDAMVTWLAGEVDAYADPSGAAGGPYSGGLAKLALVAEATGGNPHSFGGTDLLGLLRQKICTAAISGSFSPCTAKGDIYNAFSGISQALGVLALGASPVAADHPSITAPIVVRLHQLQCADGGFSSELITPGAPCTSDVDTTGFAIQALATVPGTDEWLGAAQAYLQKVQRSDGLFVGAGGVSSNSTAVAAEGLDALIAALTSPTADPPQPQTVAPIAAWQSALTGLTSLAVSGGGFRISPTTTGADVRASAQSVQAAAQRSLLALSGATIRSLPRIPATKPGGGSSTPPSSTPPSSSHPSSGSDGSSTPRAPQGSGGVLGSGTEAGGTADTGVHAGGMLQLAALLLLLGAALALAGRRRPLRQPARHARHR